MNIYAGRPFGWDWDQHLEHGYLGGDDMIAVPGEHILAPVAGTVTRTAYTVMITEPDGWRTQALELGSTIPRASVNVGEQIGVAGTRWVHWHSFTPAGVRVPARFLSEPPTPVKAEKMYKFVKKSTESVIWLTDFMWRRPMADAADLALTAAFLEIPNTYITVQPADWRSVGTDIATVQGTGTGGLTVAQDAKLTAIPSTDSEIVDEAELGAAETNAVNLTLAGVQTKLDAAVFAINEHTDQKFDGLTLSTP